MALIKDIFENPTTNQELDESVLSILRTMPVGIKMELSIMAATILAGFIKSMIKKYKSRHNGGEYKIYSFELGKLTPDQIIAVNDVLKKVVGIFMRNSEVIESTFKIKERGGVLYLVVVNLLMFGFNQRKYDTLLDNPLIRDIFDFKSAEIEGGRVYDADSEEVSDDNKQITEGLVQMFWPVVKAAVVIYAGKVIFDKISSMISDSKVDYGKYVTFGWEFDPSETNIKSVERLLSKISLDIESRDRGDIVKDVSVNVFKEGEKIVAYLMVSVGAQRDIREVRRILDKLTSLYDLEFFEIKRGSI